MTWEWTIRDCMVQEVGRFNYFGRQRFIDAETSTLQDFTPYIFNDAA